MSVSVSGSAPGPQELGKCAPKGALRLTFFKGGLVFKADRSRSVQRLYQVMKAAEVSGIPRKAAVCSQATFSQCIDDLFAGHCSFGVDLPEDLPILNRPLLEALMVCGGALRLGFTKIRAVAQESASLFYSSKARPRLPGDDPRCLFGLPSLCSNDRRIDKRTIFGIFNLYGAIIKLLQDSPFVLLYPADICDEDWPAHLLGQSQGLLELFALVLTVLPNAASNFPKDLPDLDTLRCCICPYLLELEFKTVTVELLVC